MMAPFYRKAKPSQNLLRTHWRTIEKIKAVVGVCSTLKVAMTFDLMPANCIKSYETEKETCSQVRCLRQQCRLSGGAGAA
jgi:hypothetical protein